MENVDALIMIRGGSKRIVNKNMQKIDGRTLTQIAIEKLYESKFVSKIYVSTESEEYKEYLKDFRVKIIDRPEYLSRGDVTNLDVLKHGVSKMDCSYMVHVDVCKPLSKIEQIDEVIKYAIDNKLDSVFTCKPVKFRFTNESAILSQNIEQRSIFFNNARVFKKESLLKTIDGWGRGVIHKDIPNVNPWEIDIDNEYDLICARALIKEGY